MKEIKLYVEGAGHNGNQSSALRKAMSEVLRRAGLGGCMPHIVASGSRQNAVDDYEQAKRGGEDALVLVDSEGPVPWKHDGGGAGPFYPWDFLETDGVKTPAHSSDSDCHLMVQCMESWFVADWGAVQNHFNSRRPRPESSSPIETILKETIVEALNNAAGRRGYHKIRDGFSILSALDPAKVERASPWAKRFFAELRSRCATQKGCRGHPPAVSQP